MNQQSLAEIQIKSRELLDFGSRPFAQPQWVEKLSSSSSTKERDELGKTDRCSLKSLI
jgi:hypothetical protein